MYMNSEHMVAGSGENKRQEFTINNFQGQGLIMTEFECGTWFPGILEVVKVAGMIMESRTGVMGHNSIPPLRILSRDPKEDTRSLWDLAQICGV